MSNKKNNKYEILTPSGFQNFAGVQKVKKEYLELIFSNNEKVICSYEHPFLQNGKRIEAIDIKINDFLDSKLGKEKVVDIKHKNGKTKLYDILEVDNGNLFLINGNLISHNCSFLASGETVYDLKWLLETYTQTIKDPIRKEYKDNNMWIWEDPHEDDNYIISSDVARGDANDYSGMSIRKIRSGNFPKKVAEYKGKLGTTDFANLIVKYGLRYNTAAVSTENNGLGWATVQKIVDLNYPNIIHTQNTRIIVDPERVTKAQKSSDGKIVPGFSCSSATRPLVMEALNEFILLEGFEIISIRFLNELKTLVWKGGKAQAMTGCSDDLCLTEGQLFYVYKTYVLEAERTKARLEAMYGKKKFSETRQEIEDNKLDENQEKIREQELIEKRKKIIGGDKIFIQKKEGYTDQGKKYEVEFDMREWM